MKKFLTSKEACDALQKINEGGILTTADAQALSSIRVCLQADQIGISLWGKVIEDVRPIFRECEKPKTDASDAIKENLIPPILTPTQISNTYASEADLLNTVLFGKTAKQWRDSNPCEKGNIRDKATIYQLLVLANMESYNAILIKQGKSQAERMQLLHELAVQQMTTLSDLELSNLPNVSRNHNM